MAWSKTTRIGVMLAIDIGFFLLELIVGFLVHSLALMADAFHMLNDIISLLVGLWAVNVARKATTDKYTYGWLRAEILGAFFNAVFLIALCVSIILEALTRFIDPPEIGNPKLILIVGSLGLASNLVGFLVLGGHGHSHGSEDHAHAEEHDHGHEHPHEHDGLSAAEEGHANGKPGHSQVADQGGRVADVLPEAAVVRYTVVVPESPQHIRFSSNSGNAGSAARSQTLERCGSRTSNQSRGRQKRRASSLRRSHLPNIDDISIHPASFRNEIIASTRPQVDDESSDSESDENPIIDEPTSHEGAPLLSKDSRGHVVNGPYGSHSASGRGRRNSSLHRLHNHNKPKKPGKGGHGHSHGDMGMNAMILHVLGDALGNVGVIVTALIIWLTDWPGRFYADPAVSLFITAIILRSALPLTFATSKILLQATPDHIDVNDIREDIQQLPGVISCHHVHIWQLSDTKIVASMHIQVAFPISEEGGERYMDLAKTVRKCLHAYGIHSATIQPEFCLNKTHDHDEDAAMRLDGPAPELPKCGNRQGDLCLLECVDDCVGQGCCSETESRPVSSQSARSKNHDHNH